MFLLSKPLICERKIGLNDENGLFCYTKAQPRSQIGLGRAACDSVNDVANGTGWRVVVSSGSRHGAAVLRQTNALDEVVRPFATSVEAAAAALVARVKRSG